MWEFLYNFSKISSFKIDELLNYCADLQVALTVEAVFLSNALISIQQLTESVIVMHPLM